MTDKDIGLKVIKSFWKWNKSFNGNSFKFSFDEFLLKIQPNKKKLEILLDGIGGGVREAEISDSRIETAMRNLAVTSNGKIPSDNLIYFKFLQNEAVKINWVDAVSFTVIESSKDIIKGSASIGKQLIFTGKILNFLLPAIILVMLFFFLKKKANSF